MMTMRMLCAAAMLLGVTAAAQAQAPASELRRAETS